MCPVGGLLKNVVRGVSKIPVLMAMDREDIVRDGPARCSMRTVIVCVHHGRVGLHRLVVPGRVGAGVGRGESVSRPVETNMQRVDPRTNCPSAAPSPLLASPVKRGTDWEFCPWSGWLLDHRPSDFLLLLFCLLVGWRMHMCARRTGR